MARWIALLILLLTAFVVSPMSLPLSAQTDTPLRQVWQSAESAEYMAIAAFDIDSDGDDDLAIARRNQPVQLWRNDSVDFNEPPVFTLIWSAPAGRETVALAWAVTSSDELWLAEINYDDDSFVYLVTPLADSVAVSVQITIPPSFAQTALWGDIDGDAEPDLIIGGEVEPISYLLGRDILLGGTAVLTDAITGTFTVSSLALADFDGDSRLDLVAGLRGYPTQIFPGVATVPFFSSIPLWEDSPASINTRAVLAEDFDGDSLVDLFIASVIENNRLYLSQVGGPFTLRLAWTSDQRINAVAAAAIDYDGDGFLDVALSSEPRSDVIQALPIGEHLLSNNGDGSFTLRVTLPNRATIRSRLAWGQFTGSSTPDLAVARLGAPVRIYRNELSGVVNVTVTNERAEPALGAIFFRQPVGSIAPAQAVMAGDRPLRADVSGNASLTGRVNIGDAIAVLQPVGELRTFTSAHPPIPILADRKTVITATLTITQTGIIQFIESITVSGNHSYFSDLDMTLISPAGTVVRLIAGACGNESGFAVRISDAGPDASCPPTGNAAFRARDPLDTLRGESITGVWQLVITDNFPFDGGALNGWSISALTNESPLYYTSFAPGDPPVFAAINSGDSNTLTVSASYPLLLFDLDVSLEWDARNDTAYLAQLRTDLRRVSELLYDWTNGQLALGRVRIFHDRERWTTADIRIYASNRLRPNSDRGGIVSQTTITTDINGQEIVFYPGRVRIGATWNQYGASRGATGDDWPRALAHELAHYLLFLSDNYIGYDEIDGRKVLVGVDTCPGAMNNPYREEQSEFHPPTDWLTNCAATLSHLENGQADWDTIVRFYPALAAYRPETFNQMPGPNALPIDLTEIIEVLPATESRALQQTTFSLLLDTGEGTIRLQPDRSARGFLFADDDGNGITDRLIDLGSPVRDQLEARGARPGDRLCLFEPAARRLGCVEQVVGGETTLTVAERSDWQPDIRIEPLDGQRIRVTVRSVPVSAPLQARLFPLDGPPSTPVTLTVSGGVAQADISVLAPFDQALLHLWVVEPAPRREAVTDVSLFFYPADEPRLNALGPQPQPAGKPCNPRLQTCPKDAPASLDGQAMIYDLDGVFGPGDLIAFQAATRAPTAPPPWTEQVGSGYWLSGGSDTELNGFSINLSYDEAALPPGTAGGLSIFTYTPADQQWREIAVYRRDLERRELAGDSVGPGLYALLTTLRPAAGWNLLAYPWSGESVPDAMSRLNVDSRHYRIIYGYDESAGVWQRYDPTVSIAFAPLVNTLTRLTYGRGHWVFVTDPGANSAPALSGAPTLQSALPQPPTTYYGYIAPLGNVAFSPGQTVEALINDTVCGTAQTRLINGQVGYVIDVAADQPGSAGCGIAGRQVTFRVNGVIVRGSATWGAPGAHRLDLNPTIWIPLLQRAPICLVQCQ